MKAFLCTWGAISFVLCACSSSNERALDAPRSEGSSGVTGSSGSGATSSTSTGSGTTSGTGSSAGDSTAGVTGTSGPTGTSSATATTGGSGPTTGAGGGFGAGGAGGGSSSDADAGPIEAAAPVPPPPPPQPPIPPGLLTAGAWDDNRNFDWFTAYRAATTALVDGEGILPMTDADYAAARETALAAPAARAKLDISFVIDTTGSMGDEIRYLQSEFLAVSQSIKTKYPNAETRWSLVVYRDEGDEYVTRQFDFSSDTQTFHANLAAQRADGGGDFPEAPERGLAEMAKLGWRAEGTAAKIAFWVGDAPHHPQNAQALAAAINQARTKGIHLYPVASSGVDEFTELTMRSAAQLTLGRYLFLTNDSGIGDDHKEPSIPCYFVTKLDNAILRVVDIEMSATYREPTPSEILRRGGNPQNGACTFASSRVAQIF